MSRHSDDATIRAESASSRAYDHSTHQTGDATSHVNDTRAGEVIHTTVKEFIVVFERCEPSISIPDPVNDDWVDERGEKERVAQIGLECRSFCDGTGNNRRRCRRERPLKQETSPIGEILQAKVPVSDKFIR